jgi:hypothetical protein
MEKLSPPTHTAGPANDHFSPQSGHSANPVRRPITKRFWVKTCGKQATSEKVALSGTIWH